MAVIGARRFAWDVAGRPTQTGRSGGMGVSCGERPSVESQSSYAIPSRP
jgi:hypothetical protein